MNKYKLNKIILSTIGITSLGFMGTKVISNAFLKSTASLDDNTVLHLSFDNNLLQDDLTKDTYPSLNNAVTYKEGKKNNGVSLNRDSFTIPNVVSRLSNKEKITVSFWINYGGDDNASASEFSKGIIPISFGEYNLWIRSECIGFNTSSNDVYGTKNNLKLNEWNHIIAEFNKGDITKNKLIINGVEQTLSQQLGTSVNSKTNINNLTIGAWTNRTIHTIQNSILDEIIIYDKSLTNSEIEEVQKQHIIPELRGDVTTYPKLNWVTELLPEDTLYQTGFEEGDDIHPSANTNCTKVVTEDKFLGERSLRVRNSVVYGNNGHGDGSRSALYDFNTVYGLKAGMKFTASVKIKSVEDKSTYVAMSSRGTSVTKRSMDWHSRFGGVPIIVGEDTSNTPGRIVIENFDDFYNRLHDTNMNFIANKKGTNYDAHRITVYKKQVDTATKSITGMPSTVSYKKGDVLQWIDTANPLSLSGVSVPGDKEWHSYNFNGVAQSAENYDLENRGLIPYINLRNDKDIYIDEIKFGHATKVRLYRDNNLIYEGYEAQFNDTKSIDNTAPTSVNNIKSNMTMLDANTSKRKLTLTFDESKDLASMYNYQISAIAKDGTETPKSSILPMEVMSGLKGYSYVIDKNPNTVPDNTVDTTSTTIEKEITDSGVYYLHIKAIDNNGNVSNVIHYKIDIPTLTAKANPSENMIRLDWAMNDNISKTYKVFQKKEGSNEYQSIGTNNFSNEVKVLNIYPVVNLSDENSIIPSETFTNWKGETHTLPQSARLKRWMEEPNSENPKGYGKGVIAVDGVGIHEFNENPDKYLKNPDGTWKYNVIMIGSWDYNGNRFGNSDMIQECATKIQEFVDAGYGLLLGHDVVSTINPITLNQFKDDIKVEIKGYTNIFSTYISVKKKGVLTNFPWQIEDDLVIPLTHTQAQVCHGDIWMDFTDGEDITINGGQANSYLTTNNNVAMIQTGHSNGRATPDEQKILANTLFYLNQLSSDNFLDDYSGQDVKAPDKPQIYEHNFTEDGFIDLKFNSIKDNGNTYSYYVQAEDKKDLSITTSNVVKETITSGLKGYSFIVDENPTTVPDDVIEQVDNKPIRIKTNSSKELYVHIKAIDNAGNSSETYHFRVTDMTKPKLELTLNPNSWTNGNVTINVKATDNESGIKQITLPNGNIIKGTTTSYTVDRNGRYYFKAIDYMGNETISSITVSNIDKNKPVVTINNNQNWTNKDVSVTITATDK